MTYPTAQMQELFEAILKIKSKKEAANFFRDLLTLPELTEFANRWQIVKHLIAKEPYGKISKELKVSTTTVSRVALWLNSGKGGYKSIADRVFDIRDNPDYHEPPRFRGGKLSGLRIPNQM